MSLSISEADQLLIKDEIKKAEKKTSGEVRLCIEEFCPLDVLDRSAYIFKKLDIHLTKERNGILIYLSLNDRKYSIIGDAGIHVHVKQEFWDQIGHEMVVYFKNGQLTEGIIHAIHQVGEKLSLYFPRKDSDHNELPDDIHFGGKQS